MCPTKTGDKKALKLEECCHHGCKEIGTEMLSLMGRNVSLL